jgi:hypothetical protein
MKTLSKNAKPATIVPTTPERAALVEVRGAAIPPLSAAARRGWSRTGRSPGA